MHRRRYCLGCVVGPALCASFLFRSVPLVQLRPTRGFGRSHALAVRSSSGAGRGPLRRLAHRTPRLVLHLTCTTLRSNTPPLASRLTPPPGGTVRLTQCRFLACQLVVASPTAHACRDGEIQSRTQASRGSPGCRGPGRRLLAMGGQGHGRGGELGHQVPESYACTKRDRDQAAVRVASRRTAPSARTPVVSAGAISPTSPHRTISSSKAGRLQPG